MPVNLRGGPPERAPKKRLPPAQIRFRQIHRAWKKCYSLGLDVSRSGLNQLNQAKNDFDGDPRGHSAAGAVMRGREFP